MSELKYWIWLSSLQGVRPRAKRLLIERLGGVREVYFAREADYEDAGILNDMEVEALADKSLNWARRVIDECSAGDIGIVTMQDAAYPRRLAEIYDPPLVLYVRGRLPAVDDMCAVAVVGTRSATPYGIKMAQRMGYGIVKCGGLVISGLTRGVDEAAARGALEAGGACVGVLGTAIDAVRPNDVITNSVAMTGAVVSEYAPGTRGYSSFFRMRNRITSGLSVATLVVEAPEKSGALLFAHEALEQGREIFAVPGNADAASCAGSNGLLMEGASPALTAWDVLSGFAERFPSVDPNGRRRSLPEEWAERGVEAAEKSGGLIKDGGEPEAEPTKKKKKRTVKSLFGRGGSKKDVDKPETEEYIDLQKQLEGLSEKQLAIVTAIDAPNTHIDDVIERTGLPASEVLGELTMLQIQGFVSQEPGKRFSLNIKTQK